ncbi:LysR family transcriptional regulator [Sphingomonas oleivorans]|uniref:LysR family transcriptional regulator n=1 Tax=Sphingomonas oleivorans TaxID=1735121 RepID=A0A2T5G1V1_9SPHN|nr:LysR family transcriptional regulator [Sphingomonas oleivorans]PTQ13126.1 LysR family transcriptional regulator [Sphingomonas oleivorans]
MPTAGLSELDAFACVARHRSFRRAAIERGVSPSALSHTLRILEERMGVRLLHRSTRSVMPTEAGEKLLARLAPALAEIDAAVEGINAFRDRPVGTLRLNVSRSVARLMMPPLVARFHALCPEVRLEIVTDDGFVDIVAQGFDAGVRFGESLARDMVAIPFGPMQRFAVVGAPAYLERRGIPASPRELPGHACIARRYPSGALYSWEFERGDEAIEVAVTGPLVVDDADVTQRAAEEGLGLAFLHETQVLDALRCGRLMRVLEDWCPPFPGYFLYYSSRRQMTAALRAFIDMVRAMQKEQLSLA